MRLYSMKKMSRRVYKKCVVVYEISSRVPRHLAPQFVLARSPRINFFLPSFFSLHRVIIILTATEERVYVIFTARHSAARAIRHVLSLPGGWMRPLTNDIHKTRPKRRREYQIVRARVIMTLADADYDRFIV